MLAIPAIDLKDGKVVRLLQGRYTEPIVYSHDPVETAKSWQKEGASRLHIVDLDGALVGELKNMLSLRMIFEEINVPIQVGGGLRKKQDIETILSMGAKWAILGTRACEDMGFVKEVINQFGDEIIISIDVKFRKVATRGWTEITEMEDIDLIKKLQDIGVKSFIYTDISRDGTLSGSNIDEITKVLETTGASIFYSGGVSSMEDVKKLKRLEKLGLAGVIIGKALYEGKFHLLQVKRALEGEI